MLSIAWICVYNFFSQLEIHKYFQKLANESSFYLNFASKNLPLSQESGEENCFDCVSFAISLLLTIVKFKSHVRLNFDPA